MLLCPGQDTGIILVYSESTSDRGMIADLKVQVNDSGLTGAWEDDGRRDWSGNQGDVDRR